MNHDPLCPYGRRGINIDVPACSLCELIAQVRQDEQTLAAARLADHIRGTE